MLDAMTIKQKVEFDSRSKKVTGFVNLGAGEEENSEAKEVLVFMLVGLRGHWKAPISYYLTRGLPAETQCQLLQDCFDKLTELGFQINALTMDGHASNLAMAKLLGCNLQLQSKDFLTSFQYSDCNFRTHVFLDACHMVKLMRNTLQAYNSIGSPSGSVEWQLIKDLNDIQDEIGLRFGNKLTKNHVYFQNQKMKVCLAVQTLSSSVATALESLQTLGLAKFSYAAPTVEFIKVKYNNLFLEIKFQ